MIFKIPVVIELKAISMKKYSDFWTNFNERLLNRVVMKKMVSEAVFDSHGVTNGDRERFWDRFNYQLLERISIIKAGGY